MIAGAGLTARVHLSVSCKGLANVDVGSLSDPFVVSGRTTCVWRPMILWAVRWLNGRTGGEPAGL